MTDPVAYHALCPFSLHISAAMLTDFMDYWSQITESRLRAQRSYNDCIQSGSEINHFPGAKVKARNLPEPQLETREKNTQPRYRNDIQITRFHNENYENTCTQHIIETRDGKNRG